MGLLIGDVFRRAAAATPAAGGGVARRRRAHLRGGGRAGERDRPRRCAPKASSTAIGWRGGARPTLDAVPLFAALAKLGAVFVPLNPRLSDAERAPVLAKARPHLVLTSIDALTDDGRDRATSSSPRSASTTPTSSSSPAAARARPRAWCSRTGPTSCARSPATFPAGGGATVCMFPLFHMASWSIGLGCWQAREELALVATPDAESLLTTVAAPARPPHLPHSRGVAPRARERPERVRPLVVGGVRHGHVGDAARAHRVDPSARSRAR